MEQSAEIYKGYNEAYTDHYYKWEKAQSEKYFEYRKKWEKNAKNLLVEKFPLHLDIGITNVCNLKCTFCARTVLVEEEKFRKANHMEMDLYKKMGTRLIAFFEKYKLSRKDFIGLKLPETLKGYDLNKKPKRIRTSQEK